MNLTHVLCTSLTFIYLYEMELAQHGIELRNGTCHLIDTDIEQYSPLRYLNENSQLDIYSHKGEPIELCVFTHADVPAIAAYRKQTYHKHKFYASYTRKDGPLLSLLYSTGLIYPHLSFPSGHMCVHFYPWYPPLLYPNHTLYPFQF